MTRVKTQYKCRSCGYISASYLGRCPNCGAGNHGRKTETARRVAGQQRLIHALTMG